MVQRKSNIELLRILSIFGVIILHYNGNIGNALELTINKQLNHNVLLYLESVCICAVNLFVLISGYFLCKSDRRKIEKPVKLILQVIIFSIVLYLVSVILGKNTFTTKEFLIHFIPSNYFVILYVTLYFLSPYYNIVIKNIDKSLFKKMILTMFILFSIYPYFVDFLEVFLKTDLTGLSSIGILGSQQGYTIINFSLMYFIGAYIRYNDINISSKKLLLYLLGISISIYVMKILPNMGEIALEYCNPLVIIEAVIIFIIFKNWNINYNKLINSFAQCSFTVFLFHSALLPFFKVDIFVRKNLLIMLIHLCLSVVMIYFISSIIHFMYSFVIDLISKKVRLFIRRS